MDERIRQRLVGATVLVALGVIFIPMIFDTPNEGWLGEDRPLIPAKPLELEELEQMPVPEIKPVEVETEKREPPTQSTHTSETPREPVSDERLARWAVQVGSFSSKENATRLRDSLRKQGFEAYTEETTESGQRTTRVRVGPVLDETRAEQLKGELSAKAKLDGIVVRHR